MVLSDGTEPTAPVVVSALDARVLRDARAGGYSERPYTDAAMPAVIDPDMAPPGKHVLCCFVQYAPYELKRGDWDEVDVR